MKRTRLLAVIALPVALAVPAGCGHGQRPPAPPAATAVPLTPLNHLLAVTAMVEGKGPYHFVVDSGSAGAMRVSPELANALHLKTTGTRRDGDPSGHDPVEVPVVLAGSVEIGGVRFDNDSASVGGQLPGVSADGVIGLDLFAGWTVTLDYPKRELRLSRERLAATGDHVVSFTTPHGVPQINVSVAGKTVPADIDTGSPALFSAPSSLNPPFRDQPRITGKGQSITGTFDISSADLNGALVIAGWSTPHPTLDIADRFPGANVGSRFLRGYAVTFDLPAKRVAFDK
jgi:hypothetical protein